MIRPQRQRMKLWGSCEMSPATASNRFIGGRLFPAVRNLLLPVSVAFRNTRCYPPSGDARLVISASSAVSRTFNSVPCSLGHEARPLPGAGISVIGSSSRQAEREVSTKDRINRYSDSSDQVAGLKWTALWTTSFSRSSTAFTLASPVSSFGTATQ